MRRAGGGKHTPLVGRDGVCIPDCEALDDAEHGARTQHLLDATGNPTA
jgi:hypothetical protein